MEESLHRGAAPQPSEPAALRFLRFTGDHPELFAATTPADFRSRVFEVVENISSLPREVERPLQQWPCWLESEQARELRTASVALARIFRSVPQRLFGGDAREIARFLGMPDDLMVSLLLSEPTFLDQTLCRGDFIETDHGLKLVEFNIGNLGGWQLSAFEPLYRSQPVVSAFLESEGLAASCHNSIRGLLRHVVRHTLTTPLGSGSEINLLVVVSDTGLSSLGAHPTAIHEREYRKVLAREAPGRGGRLTVARVGDLEFTRAGIQVAGRLFQAVVEQNDTRPSQEIFRYFKSGLVNCYTSPLGMVLGDKKLLALLSSQAHSDVFDEAERRVLEKHLPWTRKVGGGPLRFRGEEGGALEMLRRHREELVLKAGSSFGGADVHVGPATSEEAWKEITAAAVAGEDWVAQEYLRGKPQIFPHPERPGEGVPYDLVWGLYVFGEEYGGAFLRMAPEGEKPVLNVGHGAQVGLAFEVREVG